MEGQTKSALLWGLVGALAFGVLYQGYVLAGARFDWPVLVAGMAVVGVVTTVAAHRFETRLAAEES